MRKRYVMRWSSCSRYAGSMLVAVLLSGIAAPAAAQSPTPRARRTLATLLRQHRRLPPPALLVRRNHRSRPLALTNVKIEARIVGHLAETMITMTFYNPNTQVLEGDLYVPLPEGSTISSYGLDIDGQIVDGVVVDKDHARQVFETEVRRGVDPGLVEWTKGHNFKTRVFPIPARGTRTLRVGWVSEVSSTEDGAVYYLPLNFRDPLKSLSLRVEVIKSAIKPVVSKGGPAALSFGALRDSYLASATLKNAKLTRDLYITVPKAGQRPVRVEAAADGQFYFSIRDLPLARGGMTAGKRRAAPKALGIYWDASLSRKTADHQRELALLDKYLQRLGSASVTATVVVFRNVAERPRRYRLPAQRAALVSGLRKVVYDGATQLGSAVPGRGMGKVDLNLLFSDGISSFGLEEPQALRAPVYAINGSATASHAFLRYLALRTGGAYFNLSKTSAGDVVEKIGQPVFSFISATARGARIDSLYPRIRMPVQGAFDLAGKLFAETATITLKYGYGRRVTLQRSFDVRKAQAVKGSILRRYWAQKKVADLIVFPERNAAAIALVGKRHAIVTPGTSLIVLERLSQYLEHGIRPPAGRAEMRAQYDKEVSRRAQQQKRKQASKLARVIQLWEARLSWWNTRYRRTYYHRPPPKRSKSRLRRLRQRRTPSVESPMVRPSAVRRRPKAKKKTAGRRRAAPQPAIAMKAWDPKTPYIAALRQAPKARRYAVYLRQRDKHGAAPAFYLDCAHYFRRRGSRRLALRILSNLAELELENPALIRVLAQRLAQVGELTSSIQLFEQVLRLRREEPQSYRDLALVLERRADAHRRRNQESARSDYARSLELLAKVVMRRWARFAEIEVIALTELNNILPKARRLGIKKLPVDPRLIKQLDMDLRIVMSWDADNTDMDLHVIEPSREHAYYSHNRTVIGGMVSRDFTRGYGPEVYAIRHAMRGRYKVRTKYFSSSAAKLAGAVTLTIDVYTNYGRRNQKRRSMVLRLTKSKETFTVGTVRF